LHWGLGLKATGILGAQTTERGQLEVGLQKPYLSVMQRRGDLQAADFKPKPDCLAPLAMTATGFAESA